MSSTAFVSVAAQQSSQAPSAQRLTDLLQCSGSQSCNLPPRSQAHRTQPNPYASVDIDAFEQHDLTTTTGRRMLENEARSGFTTSAEINVEFTYASTKLTDDAKKSLDQLATALRASRLADHRFAVIGHTDATGQTAANLRLSSRRARAVVDDLRNRGGIDGARLISWGRGEENLKLPDDPDSLANRRILIVNAGRMSAENPTPSSAPAVAAPTTVYSNSAAGGPIVTDVPRSVPGAQTTIEHGTHDNSDCRRYLPSANRTVPCNF